MSMPSKSTSDRSISATGPVVGLLLGLVTLLLAGCAPFIHAQLPPHEFFESPQNFTSTLREGSAIIRVCVTDKGEVAKDPEVVESSGDPQADKDVVRWAKQFSGHYRPATRGGVPVADCIAFQAGFSSPPPPTGEKSVVVRACVDEKGLLEKDPEVVESSGDERVDAGALRLASKGSGGYKPATQDGVPIRSCFVFRVVFSLKNDGTGGNGRVYPVPQRPVGTGTTQ
jgi:hypothetical protein